MKLLKINGYMVSKLEFCERNNKTHGIKIFSNIIMLWYMFANFFVPYYTFGWLESFLQREVCTRIYFLTLNAFS